MQNFNFLNSFFFFSKLFNWSGNDFLACTFCKKKFDPFVNMLLFLTVLRFVVDVLEFLSAYSGVFSAYFDSF